MTSDDRLSDFWSGERVRLGPHSEELAEWSYGGTLDSRGRQLLRLGIELPTSVEAVREELRKRADCKDVDGVIVFAIRAGDGRPVGGLSFHSRNAKNGTFGFGITVDRAERGKGYATEAVRLILRYAFFERRFQKCNSACIATNDASIAPHKRLGFVEEGRRRRQFFMDGVYYDDILFGLTREEFETLNSA